MAEGPRQEDLKRRIRELIEPVTSKLSILLMVVSGGRRGAGVGRAVRGATGAGSTT